MFSYFVIKYSHFKRCFKDVKSGHFFEQKVIDRIKVNGHSEIDQPWKYGVIYKTFS